MYQCVSGGDDAVNAPCTPSSPCMHASAGVMILVMGLRDATT
jgi:hypothetical protein